jgi:hypothetical protein
MFEIIMNKFDKAPPAPAAAAGEGDQKVIEVKT